MTRDTKQMAELLNIAKSTVRTWTKQFDIPYKRKGVKLLFSDESYELFQQVQSLKAKHYDMNSIRAKLSDNHHDSLSNKGSNEDIATYQKDDDHQVPMSTVIESTVERSINQAIKDNNELSEKYSRATYTIGQQERDIQHLTYQVQQISRLLEEKEKQLNARPTQELLMMQQERIKALEEDLELVREQHIRTQSLISNHWLGRWLFRKLLV